MKWTYLIFLSCLFILSCRKEKITSGENYLPRPTERGKGIFGCYANDLTISMRYQQPIIYNEETGYFYLENKNKSRYNFRLFVYEGLFEEGIYAFENTGELVIEDNGEVRYGLREDGINSLVITNLDLGRNIISGRFDIELYDFEGLTNLDIRQGRFDLTYEN